MSRTRKAERSSQKRGAMVAKSTHAQLSGAEREYRLISLDLDNVSRALELAQKIAERTGQTVTVSDEDGEVLGVFRRRQTN